MANTKAILMRRSQAAAAIGMTSAGLRKLARRDPTFPAEVRFSPQGYAFYRVDDINAYVASKAAPDRRAPPHDPAKARAARTAKAARRAAEGDKAAA